MQQYKAPKESLSSSHNANYCDVNVIAWHSSFLNGEVRRPSDGGHWEELDSISNMSLQIDGGMVSPKNIPLKYLGNQIFIGMVTMQYQAKQVPCLVSEAAYEFA